MSSWKTLTLALRILHASASVVWLGGGVYFAIGVLPLLQSGESLQRSIALSAQRRFGEWSKDAAVILVATGMILMFDRLASGVGGLTYAALLGTKVVCGVLALVMVTERWRRRYRPRRFRLGTTSLVLILGWIAFLLGIGLATYYGRGIA